MKELILELVKGVPPDFRIILLSALPVTELRAAIPIALFLGMPPLKAFLLAIIGNLLPVLPILTLLDPAVKLLKRFSTFDRFFRWLFARTRKKSGDIQKYGLIGLTLFVGIPLPGTGAWTGALLAFLFGFPISSAFLAIVLGVLLAGIAVTFASVGVQKLLYIFNLEVLILGALVIALLVYFYKRKR